MSINPAPRPLRRRPLLMALAGSCVAITGIGVASRTGVLPSEDEPLGTGEGVLRLAGGTSLIQSLEVPLTASLLRSEGPQQWGSPRLDTTLFSMVGVTWPRGTAEPRVEISTRVGGVWTSWQRMPHVHQPTTAMEDTGTVGTDVAWTGPADGIRVRVRKHRPEDLSLILLHPVPLTTDETLGSPERAGALDQSGRRNLRIARRRTRAGLKPAFFRRRHWSANERWREGEPVYTHTIKQVHVHHTANSNDYRRKDVPAMIRGMYAYHTKNLGWSDIGYNFLVDRFGRIWVGRAGGPRKPVRGAHTLGFNESSTGVAVIGNYDVVKPSRAVIRAIARVAAWKLHMYGRDPRGRTKVVSDGSDKYREGRRVTLPVIDGHRDTNHTACPGRHLYGELPRIRRRARARINRLTT